MSLQKHTILIVMLLSGIVAVPALAQPAMNSEPSVTTGNQIPDSVIKKADDYIISKVGEDYFAAHYKLLNNAHTSCGSDTTECLVSYRYVHTGIDDSEMNPLMVDIRVPNPKANNPPVDTHGFVATIRDGKIIDPNPAITYGVALKTAYDFLQENPKKEYIPLPPFKEIYRKPPAGNFSISLPSNSTPEERTKYMMDLKNHYNEIYDLDLTLPAGNTIEDVHQFSVDASKRVQELQTNPKTKKPSLISGAYFQRETVVMSDVRLTPEQEAAKKKFQIELKAAADQKNEAKFNDLKKQYAKLNIPKAKPIYTMEKDWLWGSLWRLPTDKPDCFVSYTIGVSAITGKIIERKSENPRCKNQ